MRILTLAVVASVAMLPAPGRAHAGWRSELYPQNWSPGFEAADGRYLHDFSYAGYHAGAVPIPDAPPGPTVDVTASPYFADKTGIADSTSAIQRALDDTGLNGGGVVFLPAGTYRIKPPAGSEQALSMDRSGVVLRGAGRDKTFLFNDETQMRFRRIVNVRPQRDAHSSWYANGTDVRVLTSDVILPTRTINVASTQGYQAGDWIVVRADPTAAFIADHGMTGTWTSDSVAGPIFYRRIESVDPGSNTMTIDTPTRYALRVRDGARVERIPPHLEEVGIEHLSIGNRENGTSGTGDDAYDVPGTGAYEMHVSFALHLNHVVNGWVRNVGTYRPTVNASNVHILSNGIRLDGTRYVTVTEGDFRLSQYEGEGGNGNLVVVTGQDNLVTHCHAESGRHNYTFGLMYVAGNVIHRSTAKNGRLPSDFHMQLSMANLIDNLALDGDHFEAVRRTCCGHGHSTTQSVFWNIEGVRYPSDQFLVQFIVDSAQFGHGYVIGTRGPASKIRLGGNGTSPTDSSEGVGQGATLEPASLYEDQLVRRLGGPPPGVDAGPSDGTDAGAALDDDGSPAGGCGGCSATSSDDSTGLQLLCGVLVVARICNRRRRRSKGLGAGDSTLLAFRRG